MGCARSSAVHVENSDAKVENVVSTVLDWALQTAPCTVGNVRIVRGALAQALHREIEILEFSLHEGTAAACFAGALPPTVRRFLPPTRGAWRGRKVALQGLL